MLLMVLMTPVTIILSFLHAASNDRFGLFRRFVFFVTIVFISVIIAFRSENYGLDIVNYYHIFLDKNSYILDEPGLYFLNDFIHFFSSEYIVFSLFYALVINFALWFLYKKISTKYAGLFFVLFFTSFIFYQINFNIYRQGLSVIIALLSVISFFNRRFILGSFLFVLAIAFHKASILAALFILIAIMRFHYRAVWGYVALILSFCSIDGYFWTLFSKVLISFLPVFENSLNEYMRLTGTDIIPPSEFNHRNIPIIVLILLYSINWTKLKRSTPAGDIEDILLMVSVVTLGIASVFSNNVLLYDRIIIFAQFIQPCLLVLLLSRYFNRSINCIVFVLSLLQLFFTVIIWGPRNFIPEYIFYGGW